MPFDHNQFADWRISNGLSQRQLATNIGVSNQTINTWEKGLHAPSTVHLDMIHNATGSTFYNSPLGRGHNE